MRIGGDYDLQARLAARAARASSAAERARGAGGIEGSSKGVKPRSEGDQVDLAVRSQSLVSAKRALLADHPVRAELVESVKAEIAAGTYRTDATKTARGLVDVLSGRRA